MLPTALGAILANSEEADLTIPLAQSLQEFLQIYIVQTAAVPRNGVVVVSQRQKSACRVASLFQ